MAVLDIQIQGHEKDEIKQFDTDNLPSSPGAFALWVEYKSSNDLRIYLLGQEFDFQTGEVHYHCIVKSVVGPIFKVGLTYESLEQDPRKKRSASILHAEDRSGLRLLMFQVRETNSMYIDISEQALLDYLLTGKEVLADSE